jgi:hypothetical protein
MSKIQIPNSEIVKVALNKVDKQLNNVVKKINLEAANHTKHGDYNGAAQWIVIAKSVMDYETRLNAFMDEWQTIVKTTKIAVSAVNKEPKGEPKRTPAWNFYIPLLQALSDKGGQAYIKELVPGVEKRTKGELKKRDLEINKKKGLPKWQVTVASLSSRLRKEGWVTISKDKKLTLTNEGVEVIKKQGDSLRL